MGLKETAIHRAALALCRKFPDAPARTLARKLHDENPALFPILELARSAVRRVFGVMGKANRKHQCSKLKREPRKAGHVPLPASSAAAWEPFVLDAQRVLVLSDIHLPAHDLFALGAAIKFGVKYKPDAIVINGDLFDFYQISRFDRDPTKDKISWELECGRQFFAHLRSQFGKVPIVLKLGNHDERWDKYLQSAAPLLFDIEAVRNAWHGPAGIREHGIQLVADQRPIMLGKLRVLHGHEKGRGVSSPVNQARGAFLRLLSSVLEGHGHRQSEHTERTADGDIIACWSTGCLCDLYPEYARINRWSQGFATVEVEKSGDYHVELKRIIDGKVF